MARTPRIFTSSTPDPFPFTLSGDVVEYVPDPESGETVMNKVGNWEETFLALGAAPPSIIVSLLTTVSVDTAGRAAWSVPSLISYVQEVLVPNDIARWSELMSDSSRLVEAGQLGNLVEWLNEELFGRPLVRAGGSASTHGSSST